MAEPVRSAAGVRLPTSALMRNGQDTSVWIFDPGAQTVQPRAVQVITADGNDVIVAGLQPGLEVVAAGVHVLSPGQTVTRFAAPAMQ